MVRTAVTAHCLHGCVTVHDAEDVAANGMFCSVEAGSVLMPQGYAGGVAEVAVHVVRSRDEHDAPLLFGVELVTETGGLTTTVVEPASPQAIRELAWLMLAAADRADHAARGGRHHRAVTA